MGNLVRTARKGRCGGRITFVCSFDVWEGAVKQICTNIHTVFWNRHMVLFIALSCAGQGGGLWWSLRIASGYSVICLNRVLSVGGKYGEYSRGEFFVAYRKLKILVDYPSWDTELWMCPHMQKLKKKKKTKQNQNPGAPSDLFCVLVVLHCFKSSINSHVLP